MAEKPEDFNMSATVVSKIMKDAIDEGVEISKDARSAAARAASIFILYTTTCANNNATSNKRRTLTPQDVFEALDSMGFDEFTAELLPWYEAFRREKQTKSKPKSKKDHNSSVSPLPQFSSYQELSYEDDD